MSKFLTPPADGGPSRGRDCGRFSGGIVAEARGPRRRLDKRLLAPLVDEAPGTSNTGTLILAGGCFWGAQGVFQHVRGVTGAVSGYDGGAANKEVLAKLPPAVQRERPRGTNRGLARAFRCATDGAW